MRRNIVDGPVARHTPTLYAHPEQNSEDEQNLQQQDIDNASSWPNRSPFPSTSQSLPPAGSTSPAANLAKARHKLRSANSFASNGSSTPGSGPASPNQGQGPRPSAYSQFRSRYRPDSVDEDIRNDPDKHYFQRGYQFNDQGSYSDDEEHASSALSSPRNGIGVEGKEEREGVPAKMELRVSLGAHAGEEITPAERERLEWQAMLAAVLAGEVLTSEKTRIIRALEPSEARRNDRRMDIWLGLRARLRGVSEAQEGRRLDERRQRLCSTVINDILHFRVVSEGDTSDSTPSPTQAMKQVRTLLRRLDVAQSLYPSLKAMAEDKPACNDPEFHVRVDTLIHWTRVVTALRNQIATLKKWTGSEALDVSAPNTTGEVPIVATRSSKGGPGQSEHADETTFVERVLKEDSLQRTFEKGALVTIHGLIDSARSLLVERAAMIKELNLPTVNSELVQLISFPTKLMEASLRVRLVTHTRTISVPSIMVIDQMTEDYRLSIGLACTLKREYEGFVAPDSGGNWNLPNCISEDYDRVILEAMHVFFKLIHWKLKSGVKGIYFNETEIIENQRDIMNDVSLTLEWGSAMVAEELCRLTNKLMLRIADYFETQVQVPENRNKRALKSDSRPEDRVYDEDKRMSAEQMVIWFGKVLESVRLRQRKLQRFARFLNTRFLNSAEYSLEGVSVDSFINTLAQSGHVLVYTDVYEKQSTYIIGSPSLKRKPHLIKPLLQRAFHANNRWAPGYQKLPGGREEGDGDFAEDEASYLLIMSPNEMFLWQGFWLNLDDVPVLKLEMRRNRIRLVADGAGPRLLDAKEKFISLFAPDDGEDDVEEYGPQIVAEQQAHLPKIWHLLRVIDRTMNKLSETIVESVHQVRSALDNVLGRQELLENWYTFASEHGLHAQKRMGSEELARFNGVLTRLAISWVAFICDDCDPTDRKTFRWAVNALEFAMLRTKGKNILFLTEKEFDLLRQKVASCMTLLISHFDILGARSSIEQAKLAELQKKQLAAQARADGAAISEDLDAEDEESVDTYGDPSIRAHRDKPLRRLEEIESFRAEIQAEHRMMGRVLEMEEPEDRSLLFLASSPSNVSIRWQQGRFIGGGAFGSVYLAVNLDSGGLMAVKEIRFKDAHSLSALYQQVKDELSVMEILHHPNIVEYYGIEVHRDKVYIFEEYCQNGSLASLLETGRIEDENVIQIYTLQMLEGLIYLHSNGVVHRDIKPDNILLDHLGVIKYVDFGAAKILAKNRGSIQTRTKIFSVASSSTSSTSSDTPELPPGLNNSLTGTPMYMSPEVIKSGPKGKHGAMDIWSMGCVVLECATGRKPWSNLDNEWAIMFHIGVATKHPPLPERGEISDVAINFLKQCLTVDPFKRPSASELISHPWMLEVRGELQEVQRGHSNSASGSTSSPTRLSPSASRSNSAGEEGLATVAREARRIEEEEIANIVTSPPVDPVPSPTGEPPTPLSF